MQPSEQVCLFHYPDKLFFTDLPVAVSVRFVNHFLQLLVGHCLSQFSCHSLQILQWNFSCVVVVKKSESLQNLLSGISLTDLCCHQLHKVRKFNHSFTISVHLSDQLLHFLLFRFKAQSSHSHFKFLRVNVSWKLQIKYPLIQYRRDQRLP